MAVIIGEEYLIGLALLGRLRQNKNSISFPELHQKCKELQDTLNAKGKDAIVLDTNLEGAILSFSEYFQMVELDHTYYAKCVRDVTKESLESRFCGYILFDILVICCEVLEVYHD